MVLLAGNKVSDQKRQEILDKLVSLSSNKLSDLAGKQISDQEKQEMLDGFKRWSGESDGKETGFTNQLQNN